MTLLLVLLFVIGPIAEIYVLLTAGGAFGVLPVLGACVLTAVVGGFLLRIQGLSALHEAQKDMAAGAPPVNALTDGVFLVLSAPLLMTPGFITDAVGFALLTPFIRRWIAKRVVNHLMAKAQQGEATITIYPPR